MDLKARPQKKTKHPDKRILEEDDFLNVLIKGTIKLISMGKSLVRMPEGALKGRLRALN